MATLVGTANDDILDVTDGDNAPYDAAVGLGNDDVITGDDDGNVLIGDGDHIGGLLGRAASERLSAAQRPVSRDVPSPPFVPMGDRSVPTPRL